MPVARVLAVTYVLLGSGLFVRFLSMMVVEVDCEVYEPTPLGASFYLVFLMVSQVDQQDPNRGIP